MSKADQGGAGDSERAVHGRAALVETSIVQESIPSFWRFYLKWSDRALDAVRLPSNPYI